MSRCSFARSAWVACVALAGCGGGDAASTAPDADLAAGAQLFADNCSRCHGSDGAGTSDAPQIREPVHAYATYVVRNGRGDEMGFGQDMPSFDTTDLPELEPIFDWLDRPPHATDGPTLFVRHCANCHGADAQGGRVGEAIAGEESDDVLERVRGGHGGADYGARTEYMPSWSTASLSDADVSAIAAYVGALPGGHGHGDDDDDDGDAR